MPLAVAPRQVLASDDLPAWRVLRRPMGAMWQVPSSDVRIRQENLGGHMIWMILSVPVGLLVVWAIASGIREGYSDWRLTRHKH